MEQNYESIDLRDIVSMMKKNLLVIIAAAFAFSVAGYMITLLFITPQYEAGATMIVNAREEQAAQAVVTNDQINSAKQLVNTYAVILKSDTVLGKTIQDLGLDMSYEELVKKVTIEAVDATQVMRIAVKDADPELARSIVGSIVQQAPEMIIKTVKAGSVEIISQPKAGERPVSPNTMANVALAGLAGALLAAFIVFLRSTLNNKFMTDEDVSQKLGLTVLGVIPQINIKV